MRDAVLRGRIHGLIVRLSLPIDGIIEVSELLRRDPDRPSLLESREAAFEFMLALRDELNPLVDRLSRIAGEPIERYSSMLIQPPG